MNATATITPETERRDEGPAADVMGLIDQASGAVAATYTYSAYGIRTASEYSDPEAVAACAWGFDTYYWDADAGVYLLPAGGHWPYNPELGRWNSRDPLGQGPSPGHYPSFSGDPINRVDPDGREDQPNWSIQFPSQVWKTVDTEQSKQHAAEYAAEARNRAAYHWNNYKALEAAGDLRNAKWEHYKNRYWYEVAQQWERLAQTVIPPWQPPQMYGTTSGFHGTVDSAWQAKKDLDQQIAEWRAMYGSSPTQEQKDHLRWLEGMRDQAAGIVSNAQMAFDLRINAEAGAASIALSTGIGAGPPKTPGPVIGGAPTVPGVSTLGPAMSTSPRISVGNVGTIGPEGFSWPANRGSVDPGPTVIDAGTIVSRYGGTSGTYLSPAGVPFAQRAIPGWYRFAPYPYFEYEVLQPIPAVGSTAAPVMGCPGGGQQWEVVGVKSIQELIDMGVLRQVYP